MREVKVTSQECIAQLLVDFFAVLKKTMKIPGGALQFVGRNDKIKETAVRPLFQAQIPAPQRRATIYELGIGRCIQCRKQKRCRLSRNSQLRSV